jgi:Arm DNA-binding domain
MLVLQGCKMPLTDTGITTAKYNEKEKKTGKVRNKRSDGGGLYLELTPTGSKLWRVAYRFGGKQPRQISAPTS